MPANWYAIYTHPRAEKRVHRDLEARGVRSYLPLRKTLKQWSDRKKWVEEPLFRSYLFVHIDIADYLSVLNMHGVVRFVTFEGKAVIVPEQQIEAVRMFLSDEVESSEFPDLTGIKTVEIIRGPLRGIMGDLLEHKGKHHVRIEIPSVGQSVVVTVSKSNLRVVS